MSRRARARIAFCIAGACLLCVAAVLLTYMSFHERAASVPPSPSMTAQEQAAYTEESDGFPAVDWAYWRGINPDVTGWITVPGTSIDYPIVQAKKDHPTFYLKHDVYGEYNVYGCPYLDADCAVGGLFESPNAVVFGHHMKDGSMFSPFAEYSDASFAKEHRRILLQTPDGKRVYLVQAAQVVPGWEAEKRTAFSSAADFSAYWQEQFDACSVKLTDRAEADGHILTLCTCSYNFWSWNERTLVYATPEKYPSTESE